MPMDTNGHTLLSEDYVSFEVAKLLKEKGFPQEYDLYNSMVYNEEDYEDEYEVQRMVLETKLVKAGTLSSYPIGIPEPKCYCPTHQMVMKWLRDEKNIFIDIYYDCDFGEGYRFSVHKLPKGTTLETHNENYSTYEQVAEAALKYSLENLI